MHALLTSFWNDERGATAIEYGLIIAIVGAGIIGALHGISGALNSVFSALGDYLSSLL